MFTSVDKAVTAVVMGALSLANLFFGFNLGFDPEMLSGLIAAATPFLVWLVPNKG